DLAIAWTFFSAESRAAFRGDVALDDATWARGRGWCLWKALLTLSAAPADPAARRVLDAVLAG
ncbi:MAG TPA: aminoglycoside phosphotransferase, partial [Myxococcota bacterium]